MKPGRKPPLWPTFDGLSQAAASGLAPLAILKSAKAAGCPAFRSGRVFSRVFLEWHWKQYAKEEEILDLKTEQAKTERARGEQLTMKNEVTRGNLIPREIVESIASPFGQAVRQCFQDFSQRYAARCNPSDPQAAGVVLSEGLQEIMKRVHELVSAFTPEAIREASGIQKEEDTESDDTE